ncbi:MAG: hypothetical protein DI628_03305 [Blastochloris viridis]|uniref:Uncharacterized protein n=1 Tax=Blastochloris viridis TaxID=1079 RepID=A0A6N4REY9_BLAVI|nr:MAG: hypothetical protein DI628_03305 [Blastochloris viridis]
MRTIKIPSTSLYVATALLLLAASSAVAQTSGSNAENLEWPRTFTGAPDFIFTRDEAVTKARTDAARSGSAIPLVPNIEMVLEDDSELDPMGAKKPQIVMVSGTEAVSGTEGEEVDIVAVGSRQSLMDKLMAQAVDLPAVAGSTEPDLTEFRGQLVATISRTLANWQPDSKRYNFSSALNGLSLQAIVTSPVSYAVINQHRYEVGDTFRISVPMRVPDEVVSSAMEAQMPVSGTLTPALEANYRKVYGEVMDGLTAARSRNPEIGMQTLVIPVRVLSIARREVMLDLDGQPHALQIRYSY